jgi:hypothetical protein
MRLEGLKIARRAISRACAFSASLRDLDAVYGKLQALSKELDGDDRQDAVESALASTSDAAGSLTYITPMEAIDALKKEVNRKSH